MTKDKTPVRNRYRWFVVERILDAGPSKKPINRWVVVCLTTHEDTALKCFVKCIESYKHARIEAIHLRGDKPFPFIIDDNRMIRPPSEVIQPPG